jgi:hypothetical protein
VTGDDALYGDALGPPGSDGDTYIKMIRHNTATIVSNLSESVRDVLHRGDPVQPPAEADECASSPEDGPGFGASAAPAAQRPGVGQVADRLQRAGVGPQRPWGP